MYAVTGGVPEYIELISEYEDVCREKMWELNGLDSWALEWKSKSVVWKNDERNEWYILFSIAGFSDELREAVAGRKDVMLIEG